MLVRISNVNKASDEGFMLNNISFSMIRFQRGTPQSIYHEPVNEYVAGLFGTYNLLTTGQQKTLRMKPSTSHVLVRPEGFRIFRKKDINRFKVDEVRFYGHLYELKLTYRQLSVWVATTQDKYRPGDKAEISFIHSRKK